MGYSPWGHKESDTNTFTLTSWGKGGREGRKVGLGLANLSNFSRFWGVGAVPACLGPGLGTMKEVLWYTDLSYCSGRRTDLKRVKTNTHTHTHTHTHTQLHFVSVLKYCSKSLHISHK